MFLLCGLGNKGFEYALTRHNIGHLVIDRFSERFNIPLTRKVRGCRIGGNTQLILAKPDTFMNLSGGPVSSLMREIGVIPAALILIHDDLDMEFGRIRIKWDGRDGGHKGVRSVAEALGSNLFHRFKIGIGRNPAMKAEEYVLTRFDVQECEALTDLLDTAVDALHIFIEDGKARAMSMFNKRPAL